VYCEMTIQEGPAAPPAPRCRLSAATRSASPIDAASPCPALVRQLHSGFASGGVQSTAPSV
jgi:hypothetical protein